MCTHVSGHYTRGLSFLRTRAPFTRCSSGARLRIRAAQSVCHPSPFVGQRLLSLLRCSCPVRLVVGATSLPTTARVGALRAPRQGVSDDVPIAGLRLVLSGSLRVLARPGPVTAAAGTNPSSGPLLGCLKTSASSCHDSASSIEITSVSSSIHLSIPPYTAFLIIALSTRHNFTSIIVVTLGMLPSHCIPLPTLFSVLTKHPLLSLHL